MIRSLWCLAMLLLVAPALVAADEKEKPKGAKTPSEIQDMIFFGAKRPVLIRLHLYIDGEPVGTFWEKAIKRRFDYADRDKDGTLDEKELKFFPMPSSNPYYALYGQMGAPNQPTLSETDSDSDNKVTLEEILALLTKKNITPVLLSGPGVNPAQQMMQQQQQIYNPNQGAQSLSNRLTEALFAKLDANKDGKLSREELQAAEKKLLALDDDDDETVDTNELLQVNPYNPNQYQVVKPGEGMMRPDGKGVTKDNGSSFVLVPRDDASTRLTQRLATTKDMMARYDKDSSGKVTREEIGLPKDIFEQLDKNSDDVLDQFELLRWMLVAPDVELQVKLGKVEAKEYAVDFAKTKGRLADLVSRTGNKGMALVLEGASIEVGHQQSLYGYGQGVAQPNALVQQFRALDQQNGKKGFIDKKMLLKPEYRFFQATFDMADADGDEKLTEKELQVFGDIQTDTTRTMLQVNVIEVGRALFNYLDTNKDGRFSRRELLEFGDKLAPLDPDKTGSIRKESIPYQFRATVALGANPNYQQQEFNQFQQPGQQRPAITGGPTWFRKMDANLDGEVSRREFLGSPKDFEGIDTNKDGILTLSEAEAADARLRTKK